MAEAQKAARRSGRRASAARATRSMVPILMVEVLRELGIKYIALNPGASYRGLHDSMVNFESWQRAGDDHVHARRDRRGDRQRLRAGDGRDHGDGSARYRRLAARQHGDFQRLVRSHADSQSRRRRAAGHHATALHRLGAHGYWCKVWRCASMSNSTISPTPSTPSPNRFSKPTASP